MPGVDSRGNLQFLWTTELATVLSARNQRAHRTYCMCLESWVERECFPWLLNAEAAAHDSYFYQPEHVFHRIRILSINLGWFEEKCCLMSFLKFESRSFPKRLITFFFLTTLQRLKNGHLVIKSWLRNALGIGTGLHTMKWAHGSNWGVQAVHGTDL